MSLTLDKDRPSYVTGRNRNFFVNEMATLFNLEPGWYLSRILSRTVKNYSFLLVKRSKLQLAKCTNRILSMEIVATIRRIK